MTDQPAYRGKHPNIVTRPDGSTLRTEMLGLSSPPYDFTWGYDGFGPRLLAKAILLDHTGDARLSERDAREFMRDVTMGLGTPYHDGPSWELPVETVARWVEGRPPVRPDRLPFWDWVTSLPITSDPKGKFVRDTQECHPETREQWLAGAGPQARKVYRELLEDWSWISRMDEVRSVVIEG